MFQLASSIGVGFLDDIKRVLLSELDSDYRFVGSYDLDDDGVMEIIIRTSHDVRCYKSVEGSLVWKFDTFSGFIDSISIKDVDLDGKDEVIVLVKVKKEYILYILDTYGNIIKSFELGEKKPFLARIKPIRTKSGEKILLIPFEKSVQIFDQNGDYKWDHSVPSVGFYYYRVNDYNSDGFLEILFSYILNDKLYLELINPVDGSSIWSQTFDLDYGARPFIEEKPLTKGYAIFVLLPEIMYIIDSLSGEIIYSRNVVEYEIFNGTADIDGDGEKEIVICRVGGENFTSILELFYPTDRKSIVFAYDETIIDCRIGDYDGDRKEEICLIGPNNIVFFDSNGFVWGLKNIFRTQINYAIGDDFDKDGVPEILLVGDVGAAIIDLKARGILWMDHDFVFSDIMDFLSENGLISLDLDDDNEEEWLFIDEENLRLIAIKGEYGDIKELWTLNLPGLELKDVQIVYPNNLIIVALDDKLFAIDGNGEIKWVCEKCPISFIMFGELNGDGNPEILAIDDKKGLYVINIDGKILWKMSTRARIIRLNDVDGDGKLEVIVVEKNSLHVLRGENGKYKSSFIFEFPIQRVDIYDMDSDAMDEILIFGDKKIVLLKNSQVVWEQHFIEPKNIKRILALHFTSKSKKDICLIGNRNIYVFDSLTGDAILVENVKGLDPHNVVIDDVNCDNLDEIIYKVGNKIYVLGKNYFREIKIDSKEGKLISSNFNDHLCNSILLYSKRWIKKIDFNGRTKEILSVKNGQTIIDVKRVNENLYVLVMREGDDGKEFNIFTVSPLSGDIKLIKSVKIGKLFIPNIYAIKLIVFGDNFYLMDGQYLYAIKNNRLFRKSLAKKILVGRFMSDASSELLLISNEGAEIIKGDGVYSIELPLTRGFTSVKGDVDGDNKEELIMIGGNNRIIVFDILLYQMGCESSFEIETMGRILTLTTSDIDEDGIEEIIVLTSKGLEVFRLEIIIGDIETSGNESKDTSISKSRNISIFKKIKKICGEKSKESRFRKSILYISDGRKVLVWETKSKKRGSTGINMSQ